MSRGTLSCIIASSSVHQIMFVYLLQSLLLSLSLPLSSILFLFHIKTLCASCHHVQLDCHCAVTGKCSKRQWRSGCNGVRGGEGGVLVCIRFPSQVHKCPSQTTHVHNLMDLALMIRNGAQSVMDFEHVRSRKEPVLMVVLTLVKHMYGMVIPTPLWCWTFHKDGVLGV